MTRPTPPPVDEVVDHLNDLAARHSVALAHDIGGYVLRTYFDDDPDAYATQSADQRQSLRALVKHPRLRIAASTLSVYIRVECHRRAIPPDLASNLTLTQHRHLMRLPSVDERIALGRLAWQHEWTERRLGQEVRARLPKTPSGRSAGAALLVKRLERSLDDELLASLTDGSRRAPRPSEVEPLLERLDGVLAAAERIRAALLAAGHAAGGDGDVDAEELPVEPAADLVPAGRELGAGERELRVEHLRRAV